VPDACAVRCGFASVNVGCNFVLTSLAAGVIGQALLMGLDPCARPGGLFPPLYLVFD